jgi:hypothetical protein
VGDIIIWQRQNWNLCNASRILILLWVDDVGELARIRVNKVGLLALHCGFWYQLLFKASVNDLYLLLFLELIELS